MRQAFLDTEFLEHPDGPILLSIGVVCGGAEFYAELHGAAIAELPRQDIDEFVQREVLGQFGRIAAAGASELEMAQRLSMWIDSLDVDALEVLYNFNVDFLMIERLIALMGQPPRCKLVPAHVGYLIGDADAEAAAALCWHQLVSARGLRQHHALADALALRAGVAAVHGLE
jgi:hypothetical protein